ncbi:putative heat shock protein [Trypanosoma theileri]|uniref:Putative heat shock protein n=1 Tax=Trypanosoma theileri TaxID=67003 RepID=A0A1X0NZR6_9TRYP|nr:putative heat shock protein [Trypanosoma theileri]ORC89650.1 putative heat shock protein [Trypanosoma theileri]
MRSSLSTLWSFTTPVGLHRYLHTTTIARRVGRGSFFAHLNLPKSPELDTAAVQRAYHDLQRRVHPDQANVQAKENEGEGEESKQGRSTFPSSSSSSSSSSFSSSTPMTNTTTIASMDRVADVDESMYANVAYETLRDPFLRCKYLARLSRAEEVKGGPLSPAEEEALMAEDDRRTVEENRKITGGKEENLTLSQEFLVEMMAANESIFTVDTTEETGRDTLKLLIAHLGERYEEYYTQAREYWKTGDYQNFRRCVLEWTYIRNALIHAKNRLD